MRRGKRKSIFNLVLIVMLLLSCLTVTGYYLNTRNIQVVDSDKKQNAESIEKPKPEILFSAEEVLPGGYISIFIKNAAVNDTIETSTVLAQQKPHFFEYKDGKLAIAGFSCRTKDGEYKYSVRVIGNGETAAEKIIMLKVLPKEFDKQYLTVTKTQKQTRTDDKLAEDNVYKDKAKAITSDKPLWEGTFIRPVDGKITTAFGMIRYINKEESERHSGLDLAAPKNTPVKAANGGVVRLAMMLNVTGNTIIIDHGCNINTSYAHMDKLLVKEGDIVKKGDIIGEVGSTGFSTGPHLHWTASIGNTYIDPDSLIEKDPIEAFKGINQQ
ncbi:MAG: M23 family metallopeptidase [Caulobacteraceae bacterium]